MKTNGAVRLQFDRICNRQYNGDLRPNRSHGIGYPLSTRFDSVYGRAEVLTCMTWEILD